MTDISEGGARLRMAGGDPLPDSFMLQIGLRQAPHRQCRVVWREEDEVGIRFEDPVKPKPKAKLRQTGGVILD
jgi:hypothetical protein